MKIKIKDGLEIGDDCPPFIIAEIGSNWRNLEDCLFSIHMAKECGADAVKFQAYDQQSLYGRTWSEWSVREGLCPDLQGVLPLDWLPALKEKADQHGVEFMCSAFSPELVNAVDPFVNVHKVASAEMTHVRILEKLRELGKPVILSTGASGVQDIKRALHVLENVKTDVDVTHSTLVCPIVLMYCISAYPAKRTSLTAFSDFSDRFPGTLLGYSDHAFDTTAIAGEMLNMGACVFEKHVTFIDSETPDSPHSLNADEFKEMAKALKTGIGPRWNGPTREEKPMILRHNRRLIATKKIVHGEELQEGYNFGIYRSLKDETHAFSPFMIEEVNGRRALKVIEAGDGIGPGDI